MRSESGMRVKAGNGHGRDAFHRVLDIWDDVEVVPPSGDFTSRCREIH